MSWDLKIAGIAFILFLGLGWDVFESIALMVEGVKRLAVERKKNGIGLV